MAQQLKGSEFICECHFGSSFIKREDTYEENGKVFKILMDHPRLLGNAVPTLQKINHSNDSTLFESETIDAEKTISDIRPCDSSTSGYDLTKLINCAITLHRVDKYDDCADCYLPVFSKADLRLNRPK